MQFINYFFASIISFLGLLVGILLIRIAPEEQKPLQKYFAALKFTIMLLIFFFAGFYHAKNWPYLFVELACLAFLLFMERYSNDLLKKSKMTYAALGIVFFLSSQNPGIFIIESSLIFLYGIAAASLIYTKKKKIHCKLLLYNSAFLIIANLLFLF